jgi:hypothetical protein
MLVVVMVVVVLAGKRSAETGEEGRWGKGTKSCCKFEQAQGPRPDTHIQGTTDRRHQAMDIRTAGRGVHMHNYTLTVITNSQPSRADHREQRGRSSSQGSESRDGKAERQGQRAESRG